MVRPAALCALLILAACASAPIVPAVYDQKTLAYPFDEATVRRADVERCALRVLELGGWGNLPAERAAFLVYHQDDVFDCVVWPATNEPKAARWEGDAPEGTAAVIHNHPSSTPYPSTGDVYEARRQSIPVFVVTREVVSMVSPEGEVKEFPSLLEAALKGKGQTKRPAVTSKAANADKMQTARVASGQ